MDKLTDLRHHARMRAEWRANDLIRAACQDHTPFGTPKPPDHANCGGHRCGCDCHRPTDKERHMWQAIADEIDTYLAPDEQDRRAAAADPEQVDLFELIKETP